MAHPERAAPPVTSSTTKTWVEIELLDQDGNPVPGISYELTLPGGRKIKGSLDSSGLAMVRDIEPGQCTLSFPELDGSEWDPA